jgi:hypothetical integral membrane protein (TIGR02206 family)
MAWFGSNNNDFAFEMFSVSHFVVISILFLGSFTLYLKRENLNYERWRKAEVGIAISLIVMEGFYHVWMLTNGIWDASYAIPLELCSLSLILTVILLLTRNKYIYEILLFTALLGATQAIITPLLHHDFPHFRYFHFFYTHLMMIWVAFYFTWVKGYRPTILSVFRLFFYLNVLMPFIMLINKHVGGNYMFLSHKPTTASLLDFLGPYPWYILSLEALLITLSLIVWLIFREKKRKSSY